MKSQHLFSGLCATVLTIFTLSANAALLERLGGLAYYDDEADLTWLADANYAQTSGYDVDGNLNWSDANYWASQLNISGVTGWRLPKPTLHPGCTYGCSEGEIANLFINVLGSDGYSLNNYNPFSNVGFNAYWLADEYDSINAWYFVVEYGQQITEDKIAGLSAWAVHDGDVNAVPIPAAIWLFSTGLIALFGIVRKKAA